MLNNLIWCSSIKHWLGYSRTNGKSEYPTELQLNKANFLDNEAPFLGLDLSITNGIFSSKIYDKRTILILKLLISHFLTEMFFSPPSYGVYISQLIRFAKVCSNVDDFNKRNRFKLGKQIQTSLRLISVSLSNVLYCIYDVSVVSRCTLYLNKILFTLKETHFLLLS